MIATLSGMPSDGNKEKAGGNTPLPGPVKGIAFPISIADAESSEEEEEEQFIFVCNMTGYEAHTFILMPMNHGMYSLCFTVVHFQFKNTWTLGSNPEGIRLAV